jgi:hypothetical protein
MRPSECGQHCARRGAILIAMEDVMATIIEDMTIEAPVALVWDALSDVGALHRRLCPGFVTDTVMDGEARIVTFANGLVAREEMISVDPLARRVAWTAKSERLAHHNGAAQLFEAGPERCRFVWTADDLPHAMAPAIGAMMEQGMAAIRTAMEKAARADAPAV